MIVILSRLKPLTKELKADFDALALPCRCVDGAAIDAVRDVATEDSTHNASSTATLTFLEQFYLPGITAAIVDHEPIFPNMPLRAWHDLVTSLARRIPVIMIDQSEEFTTQSILRVPEEILCLHRPTSAEIIALLDACGATGRGFKKIERAGIPVYNPQVPVHMLKHYGALSVLSISASAFQKVALEFGNEAYTRLQDCFHHILFDLWGAAGCFRSSDILCRKTEHGNNYYVFLEQSRATSSVPAPGVLERLADRLVVRVQNALWNELFMEKSKRMLPGCLTVIPEFAIGHSTVIYNPCVDATDQVEQLLETSADVSRLQSRRMKDRQRELMQTLIQTNDLLYPNYQAVFHLGGLQKSEVDAAHAQQSMQPLVHRLYGFESLIRVRRDLVDAKVASDGLVFLESRFLRPDVLFELAHSAKVVLELDQACLGQAIAHSRDLPGTLMVNILPRNLYYVERLRGLLGDRKNLMFEVSESEAISNFDLMVKVRDSLEAMNVGIATDDFGRGYAGLERIIKIRPDVIKLDRSLIENIHQDKPKQAFVAGLVEAARIAKSVILAEGVELWEEAEHLKNIGIELIQGFLLHKPQPVEIIMRDIRAAKIELAEKESEAPASEEATASANVIPFKGVA